MQPTEYKVKGNHGRGGWRNDCKDSSRFFPQDMEKQKLYTIEEEEGYQHVKRYKVTWKF